MPCQALEARRRLETAREPGILTSDVALAWTRGPSGDLEALAGNSPEPLQQSLTVAARGSRWSNKHFWDFIPFKPGAAGFGASSTRSSDSTA